MAADYGPSTPMTQGQQARLLSAVKSDGADFETCIKGFRVITAGDVVFVPARQTASVTLTVGAGDVVTEWLIKRINSTGTTADGYTIEG